MRARTTFLILVVLVAAAALVFSYFQRRLAGGWMTFGVQPEVAAALEGSLDDLKQLARRDPESAEVYRQRFEANQTLLNRLRILRHNRGELAQRYEQLVLGLFVAVVAAAAVLLYLRQTRHERRLGRLQAALAELAHGSTEVHLGERRRDTIGRIAAMIEQTSKVMARDRRRLAQLANLSAWQEAARRHAHEMKTPLTGARLELVRLRDLLAKQGEIEHGREIRQAGEGALQEIERLAAFTRELTAAARLPRPRPERRDLGELLREFTDTFAAAWPNLELRLVPPAQPCEAMVDRDMLRQVLVNLCDNSALALGDRHGCETFSLATTADMVAIEVADDGPGVAEAVRERLFEPYTTTRRIGHGMGLGLAISKKILLDHGGDLELAATSPAGTTFRLTLPRNLPEETR